MWTLFCFPAIFSFGQEEVFTPPVKESLTQLVKKYPSNTELKASIRCAIRNQWDSVLVHSNKALITASNLEITNYLHFLRARAFRNKELPKQSLIEIKKIKSPFEFSFLVNLMKGEIELESGDYKKALSYFLTLDTTNIIQVKAIRLDALQHNIGSVYNLLGEYELAENYLRRSILKVEKKKDYKNLISSYTDLANVYYEQYQDNLAIPYFEKAYILAQKYGSVLNKQQSALNMSVVEENRKNYLASIQFHKEYEQWSDSLNDQNKIYEVAQIEKKFAVDQKQKQVKLLRTENQLKQTERNMYLFAAVLLFIILAFGIYFFQQNVRRSRVIFKQKQELDALNATKDQLFSIVSHDLRSSVHALRTSNTTLKDKLGQKDYESLEDQLEQNSGIATNTYNMLDNLLHWALLQTEGGYFKQEQHRLSMLVDQVAYNFRGLLAQKGVSFENQLPKNAKVFADAESLKIVFRNFMDNSIKFASENGTITVSLDSETEQNLTLIWADNGLGMSEETRLKLISDSPLLTKKDHEKVIGSGLGMNLVKSMLGKNNGKLAIWSEPMKGTKMIVTLQKL